MVMEGMFEPEGLRQQEVFHAPEDAELESNLEQRFDPERLAALCNDYLENGIPGINLKEQIHGRDFVVAYIPADSPYGDIGRSVEYQVFAKAFRLSLAQMDHDYAKYDEPSVFAVVIDVKDDKFDKPAPAGVLRSIHYKEGVGFKDINDLVVDDPSNPWIDEIKTQYFEPGEEYDSTVAWARLAAHAGVELKPEECFDIATHAAGPNYAGADAGVTSTSMLFFHACLRESLANNRENLLAIFDLKPLANVQQFGGPFDFYEGLGDYPYGGPFPTRPAYCKIDRALERIGATFAADAFIYGKGLESLALMPNEYLPEIYSNKAVGLEEQVLKEIPELETAPSAA